MLADPLFLGTAVLAILIAGLSKGGFGSAAAFASTPILALVVPATTAAAILLPILMVIDLTSLYAYRKVLNWRSALPMMMASVVGIGLGWWFFGAVDEAWIRLALGVFALVFVLYFIFRPKAPTAGKSRLWLLAGGGFWGSIAGFTSFVAHAGGPPVAMHLLPQNLSKTEYQGTTVLFFWWANLVKLGPYAALGLLSTENLTTSAALIPVAIGGALLGVYAHKHIPERWFYRSIYVLVTVTAAKLIYDGIAGILG